MLRRYLGVPIIIGFLTGIFAVLFIYTLEFTTFLFQKLIVGYYPPLPAGEDSKFFTLEPARPFLLPFTVALGGLISGIISYFFAPESMGVGTDAAIRAYHKGEKLSVRSSIAKLITSAITIGSGGTSGREGPIALIGAGLGSSIASWFNLKEKERREALAIGLGAGVAAIFKAPLAGAIISAEVFFKRDFYIETMIPSFVASVVSYSVFGSVFGFQPIFSTEIPPFKYSEILHLLAYAILGIICGIFSRFYTKVFFTIQNTFKRLPVAEYLKPAIGGFVAGAIGAVLPPVIGNGYGWLQLIMDGEITDYTFIFLSAIGVVLGVSFTIGSGGSGGVFGPSVMIGGLLGASFSLFMNSYYGTELHTPSFTIVGMVALFAAAAKAPLSTLILIAEMTGGYDLLVPAMIAVPIAYFLSGERSIFPSQVNTRLESPAHRDEFGMYILESLKVKDYMCRDLITVDPSITVEEALKIMQENLVGGLPVVKNGKLLGIVTRSDLMKVPPEKRKTVKVYDVMTRNLLVASPEDTLSDILRIMSTKGIGRLPVVESKESKKIVGIITRADIGRAIREWKKE